MRDLRLLGALAAGLIFASGCSWAQSACDLNGSGGVDVVDAQLAINMNLGLLPCTASVYSPGVCNIIVVQRVINAALGGTCLVGTGAHSATLSWTASVSPNVTGYNVYRGAVAGGPYTKITSQTTAGVTYTDTTVAGGSTYYYVVTAVDSAGSESTYSNEAVAVIPSP